MPAAAGKADAFDASASDKALPSTSNTAGSPSDDGEMDTSRVADQDNGHRSQSTPHLHITARIAAVAANSFPAASPVANHPPAAPSVANNPPAPSPVANYPPAALSAANSPPAPSPVASSPPAAPSISSTPPAASPTANSPPAAPAIATSPPAAPPGANSPPASPASSSIPRLIVPYADVFMCHASDQKRLVGHFVSALRRHGFTVFVDVDSVQMGQEADETIKPALKNALAIVVLVSEEFVAKSYPMKELGWVLEDHETRTKAIPVLHGWTRKDSLAKAKEMEQEWQNAGGQEVGEDNAKWPAYKKLKTIVTLGNIDPADDHHVRNEAKLVDEVVHQVDIKLGHPKLKVPEYTVALDGEAGLVDHFIINKLGQRSRCAIHGQGGIGKSTLAKFIFNRLKKSYNPYDYAMVEMGPITPDAAAYKQHIMDCLNSLLSQYGRTPAGTNLAELQNTLHAILMNKCRRVLLLLDNVWHHQQLMDILPPQSLDGNLTRLPNSIVLCTTRHLGALERHFEEKFECHSMPLLTEEQSRKMFRWHALGAEEVEIEDALQDLEKQLLKACQGLPLALEMVGSYIHLHGVAGGKRRKFDESVWQDALNQLRNCDSSNHMLSGVLAVSLEALHVPRQDMFLDIVCIFRGRKKMSALWAWHGLYREPFETVERWLQDIINASLVSEDGDGCLQVHDVVHNVALRSIRQRAGFEWEQQRWLWDSGQSFECVAEEMASNKQLRALVLIQRPLHELPANSIPRLTNLRFLHLSSSSEHCNGWLATAVCPRKLVWLRIDNANWVTLPESMYMLKNLRVLRLSNCGQLQHLSSHISCLKWLRELDLRGCTSLRELPTGLTALVRLYRLSLSGCLSLWSALAPHHLLLEPSGYPDVLAQLTALQDLDLSACSMLRELPSGVTELTALTCLDLSGCTSLGLLPKGLSQLARLQELSLNQCSNLKNVPDGIGRLHQLKQLFLRRCTRLQQLPEMVSGLTSLQEVSLSGSTLLRELPAGISCWASVKEFYLRECSSLQYLPADIRGMSNLRKLDLTDCKCLKTLPEALVELSGLQVLILSGCSGIVEPLPGVLGGMTELKELGLRQGEALHEDEVVKQWINWKTKVVVEMVEKGFV